VVAIIGWCQPARPKRKWQPLTGAGSRIPMGQRQQISTPAIVSATAGHVKRIWILLLTFYQRVRDHLAALELDPRNDLRQGRGREEITKRFWQK
jgi:hypothetical protein